MKQYSALCCYFGKWPNHFQAWLSSCKYNVGIDFYLVTDISASGFDVPHNVHIVEMSFAEVVQLVRSKFPNVEISLSTPYKLCDFKTAYGYIFDHIFSNYSYWGFFDIDTIWGNILNFVPENSDSHLVRIFPCGHLSFIRNIAPYNKIFEMVNSVAGTLCRNNMAGKRVVTWQECFASSQNYYYDEEGGLEPLITSDTKLCRQSYLKVDFDNILPPWRFRHFLSINFPKKSRFLGYDFSTGTLQRVYLKRFSLRKEAISYVHFPKRELLVSTPDVSEYSIIPNRFIDRKCWTIFSLMWHCRPRYLFHFFQRCKRKIKKLLWHSA